MWHICHYGVGHNNGGASGRYPWGSGDRLYQRTPMDGKKLVGAQRAEIDTSKMSKKEIQEQNDKINRKGRNSAGFFAMKMALDVVTLNPIGLISDASKLAGLVAAGSKKNKIEKRWKNEEVDKSTGFHLKNKEFSEAEDMAAVNPEYTNLNTDTKNNCMLCSTTYELRRRGYDVTANKAGNGYVDNTVKLWFDGANMSDKITAPDNKNSQTKAMYGQNKGLTEAVVSELSKQPVGARGNLCVAWGGGGAHSIVYEVTNSGVILRDCQINKVYTDPGKVINRCVSARYARLDDKKINKKNIKEVCR